MVGKNNIGEYYDWLRQQGITHQDHILRDPLESDEVSLRVNGVHAPVCVYVRTHEPTTILTISQEGAEPDSFAWQLDQLIRLIFRNLKLNGQTFSEMRPPDDASKNGGRERR